VFLIPERLDIDGSGTLKGVRTGRGPAGDIWENCVWEESVSTVGRDLYLFQGIHQESDVVPENVDAIRAVTGSADAAESIETTNETLGIGLWVADSRPIV